jgi:hypothetical protein
MTLPIYFKRPGKSLATILLFSSFLWMGCSQSVEQRASLLDVDSQETLSIPALSLSDPAAGKRVNVTASEYAGTQVYHTLYLPDEWSRDGERLPIIFEYTGNYFPKSGSTGEVKDAGLGFGLSGGKYIWVSLPYIHQNHKQNQGTWWGDDKATVEYAKVNVRRIIEEVNADPNAVFLCGFSRGAIGVNYLGLYDDEIAKLWTAFITHDHFDGIKEWGNTTWGSPLGKYRAGAIERLKRVGNRPYLVCQNGDKYGTEKFVRSTLVSVDNFTFIDVRTVEIFGSFPHPLAKAAHTDMWPLLPSQYRTQAWEWMNKVTELSK